MAELKSTTIEAMRKTEAALRQKLESLERTVRLVICENVED